MSNSIGEEHELPQVEAVLAGTLALMTGYSQSLLAELHPQHRVLMGRKIGSNLDLLTDHPQLSTSFQKVLSGLQRRWELMAGCSAEAAPPQPAMACEASTAEPPAAVNHGPRPTQPLVCKAPARLQ